MLHDGAVDSAEQIGRCALLVIDVQRGFDSPVWGRRNNPDCEQNIATLIEAWRARDWPLVFIRHDSREPDSPLRTESDGNRFKDMVAGEPDLLVSKNVNSAFYGDPDLEAWLRGNSIRAVAICGITSNHCCETTRVSVPVLWDKETRQIVSNESGEIMRMLETEFGVLTTREVDLYPVPLRDQIDALNESIYESVNNGVYTAGFTTRQDVYEQAFEKLFDALDQLEERLVLSRFLFGDALTEADLRLFVSLVRFDAVDYTLFKCNRRRIVDYPNLWGFTRDVYQQPLVAATVSMDQIKSHYYRTHDAVNPSRVVPRGPQLDFSLPHGRVRRASAS